MVGICCKAETVTGPPTIKAYVSIITSHNVLEFIIIMPMLGKHNIALVIYMRVIIMII